MGRKINCFYLKRREQIWLKRPISSHKNTRLRKWGLWGLMVSSSLSSLCFSECGVFVWGPTPIPQVKNRSLGSVSRRSLSSGGVRSGVKAGGGGRVAATLHGGVKLHRTATHSSDAAVLHTPADGSTQGAARR